MYVDVFNQVDTETLIEWGSINSRFSNFSQCVFSRWLCFSLRLSHQQRAFMCALYPQRGSITWEILIINCFAERSWQNIHVFDVVRVPRKVPIIITQYFDVFWCLPTERKPNFNACMRTMKHTSRNKLKYIWCLVGASHNKLCVWYGVRVMIKLNVRDNDATLET